MTTVWTMSRPLLLVVMVTALCVPVSCSLDLCSSGLVTESRSDLSLTTPHFPQWYSADRCSCAVAVTSQPQARVQVAIFVQTLDENAPWCQPELQFIFRDTITSVCPSLSTNASFQYDVLAGEELRVLLRNTDQVYTRTKIGLRALDGSDLTISCEGATIVLGLYSEVTPGPAALGAEKGALAAGAVVLIVAVIILLAILIKIRCSAGTKPPDGDLGPTTNPPSTKEYQTISVSDGVVQPIGLVAQTPNKTDETQDGWSGATPAQNDPWEPFSSVVEKEETVITISSSDEDKHSDDDVESDDARHREQNCDNIPFEAAAKPKVPQEVTQPLLSVYSSGFGTPILFPRNINPDHKSLDRSRPGSSRSTLSHTESVSSYHGIGSRSSRPGSARFVPKHPINLNRVEYPLKEIPTPRKNKQGTNAKMDQDVQEQTNTRAPIASLRDEDFSIDSDTEDLH